MRLVVDLNRCQGYAQCVFLAPEVFALHGDEALRYTPYADDSRREQVARAVAACPVQAIFLDEVDETGEAGEAYDLPPVGSDVR
ncbi:ferredoxin [Streptomyces sp. NPDC059590]|uniref:ferredoxin n=1 Tax=Streptomyces sp. NPDC059590 TaxID=3346877 RepID=UPI00367E9E9C